MQSRLSGEWQEKEWSGANIHYNGECCSFLHLTSRVSDSSVVCSAPERSSQPHT
ncbi:MAG: hypothetical protein ACTSU2_03835 [Promethearchaeota archaeon]